MHLAPLITWPCIYAHGKYGGVDQGYSRKCRPGGSKIALVQLLYHRMHRMRLGGSGKNFWKIWCSEMASETFLGLKASLGSLHFSLGMVTQFTSRPRAWRLMFIDVHWRFQVQLGEEAAHDSQSIFCYSGSYSKQHRSRMWLLRSQSACSQVFAVLFYTWTTKFVREQICVGNMCVSCLQADPANPLPMALLL